MSINRTIREAEDAIRWIFKTKRFRGTLKYEPSRVIEADRWWYIPFCSIGCAGFIVNKDDLYVNWLGSGLSLDQCIWGHEHGVYSDLVDFTFSPATELKLAARLLARFKHMHPNAKDVLPNQPVWYRDSEIGPALFIQFPIFRRHFAWFAIPELIQACDKEGLQFSSCLSNGI
jgi:hypothetical protein